jgi:hypothetical protein
MATTFPGVAGPTTITTDEKHRIVHRDLQGREGRMDRRRRRRVTDNIVRVGVNYRWGG